MKVLIANDSFKGSLDTFEVAESIEKGIKKANQKIEIIRKPLADGGEGTVKALVNATNGQIHNVQVIGPLGDKLDSFFGILGDKKTAVIEMAAASGLPLVPEEKRNPMVTTTYGTGELIKIALDKGCREFILGIGGSATNDGGVGMAQALGISFLDDKGQEVGFGGGSLKDIKRIKLENIDNRIKKSNFVIACDVDNPLCGPKGASYVYGPQKGANEEMVLELDKGLNHLGDIISRELSINIKNEPGAGAAGGLGGGMMAFLNAQLKSGIDLVMKNMKLEDDIKNCDLVITGEGKIDDQTIYGKVPFGVAKLSKKYDKPVIAIAGSVSDKGYIVNKYGIDAVFSIMNYPMYIEEAMNKDKAKLLIESNVEQIIRIVLL
ncbi:glycerate kinase [Sporosalibacterium faouarense]|uniref:glycerate kinase family protein n=1 Tax=Sporosalibacterium faouarense TaxID=516123 RepID=UPI00192B6765|nr:glycerate kinase [Sporosalibacterium faouarense]